MKFIHAVSLSLMLLMASSTAVAAENDDEKTASEKVTDKKTEESFTLDPVVVTAPLMTDPLTVETDPKAPRQPLPPNDGGSRLNVLINGAQLKGACPARMDPTASCASPEAFDKITVLKGISSVSKSNISGKQQFAWRDSIIIALRLYFGRFCLFSTLSKENFCPKCIKAVTSA